MIRHAQAELNSGHEQRHDDRLRLMFCREGAAGVKLAEPNSAGDGGKQARSRGDLLACFLLARKAAGASSARHSLRPSLRAPCSPLGVALRPLFQGAGRCWQNSRERRGEIADSYSDVMARSGTTKILWGVDSGRVWSQTEVAQSHHPGDDRCCSTILAPDRPLSKPS